MKSALFALEELVPRYKQDCLSETIFDGTELARTDILEGIARYAKCWIGTAQLKNQEVGSKKPVKLSTAASRRAATAVSGSSTPNESVVDGASWHCWGRGCRVCDDTRAQREAAVEVC